MARLRFLGTSDSQGVPRWWCDCSVCAEARDSAVNARTRASVLLTGGSEVVLIDPSPEFRLQISSAGFRQLDAVLITHAHNDHILGLGDVADFACRTKRAVPIYAPAEVLPQLQARFPYLSQGNYAELIPFHALGTAARTFAGCAIRPYRVPHGHNGWAYGFRAEAESSWAYIPDSIGMPELDPWRGLDTLILGTSFYHERADYHTRSIYDVQEALQLIADIKPGRTVFTHLGHGIDRRKPAPAGTCYAFDGLVIDL